MADDQIDEARRTSFDRQAELYDAARPSYPAALVDDVIARCAPRRMLEVGAGTGKATVAFARTGRELVAIEPGENLAAVLRRNVAGFPQVTVEQTTFEAYPGSGFDLVYAAQAFHWVDPAVRYTKAAQVLRPRGWLAVIRNENAAMEAGLRGELDAVYARWRPGKARTSDDVAQATQQWTSEIAASGRFDTVELGEFPWTASYTSRSYLDLLTTYSDHALLPEPQRTALFGEIAALIERRGGSIEVPYVALAFVARVLAPA
jgi:SAM-dependent methyltransferase